jgi:hypothetical protein
MLTIEELIEDIRNKTGDNDIGDFISEYVNNLSSDQIYFALEGVSIQDLMEFINMAPTDSSLCCGLHYSKVLLKSFLLYNILTNLDEIELNMDDSTG